MRLLFTRQKTALDTVWIANANLYVILFVKAKPQAIKRSNEVPERRCNYLMPCPNQPYRFLLSRNDAFPVTSKRAKDLSQP